MAGQQRASSTASSTGLRRQKQLGKKSLGGFFPSWVSSLKLSPRSQVGFEREQPWEWHSQEGPFLMEFGDGSHLPTSNQVFMNLQEGG